MRVIRPARALCAVLLLGSVPAVLSAQDAALRNLDRFRIDARLELHAVASRTMSWLTGTVEQNDYISVGRFANFFGFVKFRVSSAHSLTRSATGQEAFAILDPAQRAQIVALWETQERAFGQVASARLDINRTLDRMRSGEAVGRAELLAQGAAYGEAEAGLGRVLAEGLGAVAVTLEAGQRTRLAELRQRAVSGGGAGFKLPRDVARSLPRTKDLDIQELWNLSSRLLTWVTGTPADNDFETVGKPSQHFGFVGLRVESGHAVRRGAIAGEVLELLDEPQRRVLEGVVEGEVSQFQDFLAVRSELCREFERALSGQDIDAARVAALGRTMGTIEAEMTWGQARGILAVRDTMRDEQAQALLAMRARFAPDRVPDSQRPSVDDGVADTEVESSLASRIARGRQVFAQCVLCHAPVGGGRSIGPSLDGVLGRAIASVGDYPMFSPALRAHAAEHGAWTEGLLDAFLASPRQAVPGTIMGFDGVRDAADRAALIAYLRAREVRDGAAPRPAPEQGGAPVVRREVPTQDPQPRKPTTAGRTRAATNRPNFVLLLSDDQDAAGLSVRMDPDEPLSASSVVSTPAVARLAAEGMRFPRGYAPAPVCSPTRASIQTGLTPARLRWTKAAPNETGRSLEAPKSARHLAAEYTTIAEVLRAGGYATAHFGKWHLGGGGPESHGYEVSDGDTGNQDAIPHKDPNPVDIFGMTERAEAFIGRAVQQKRPFFVQMSYHALHHPENARAESIERQRAASPRGNDKAIQRAALAEDLDEGVGRLLAFLDEAGLRDTTFVVYTSDNGGGGGGGRNASYLNGGKGGLAEGGIRVPFIVAGPGIEAGAVVREPVVGFDFFPTFVDLAGLEAPQGLDGRSFKASLLGQAKANAERDLLFHFPHYQGKSTPQSALIRGRYKLVREYESGAIRLYDLEADPRETKDVQAAHEDLTQELRAELERQLEESGAELPTAAEEGVAPPEPAPAPERVRRGGRRKEP
ncbi:MAG: sulfatase-like hydrolase/transferase [Planctomycetota bacterium]